MTTAPKIDPWLRYLASPRTEEIRIEWTEDEERAYKSLARHKRRHNEYYELPVFYDWLLKRRGLE